MAARLLTWALRRLAFILACGAIGAIGAAAVDGSAAMGNGFWIGSAVGLGLLAAWFALRELV